jgi:uncharacterized membrane protein (DUF4010 family)
VELDPAIVSLGLALGVGLLVGFERERQPDTVAGVRTFGLAGLVGGLAAMLTPKGAEPWPLVVVAVAAAFFGVGGGIARAARAVPAGESSEPRPFRDLGLTTGFALLATTLLGGLAMSGERTITLVAAGVLFLLLYIRDPLHAMIRRLGQEDVRAIATFVLVALVILPVLPDEPMGPYGAVNPRGAWLLVVLVVSLSLAGYIAQALLGTHAGVIATGLLGGLVSSTATTVGAARRARAEPEPRAAGAIVQLACGVLPLRLIVLVGIASPAAAATLWPWLALVGACTLAGGSLAIRGLADSVARAQPQIPAQKNPTELRSALAFAGVFVLIRVASKATIEQLGMAAFLGVAAVSGISDMDAIALSAAREVADGGIDAALATRATLVALLVNTLFKLGVTRVLGSPALFRRVLPGLAAAALAALAGIVFA